MRQRFLGNQMPDMDGFEATQRIRAEEAMRSEPSIPIIGLSANVLEAHQAMGAAAGMDSYIGKPIDRARTLCDEPTVAFSSLCASSSVGTGTRHCSRPIRTCSV